MKNLLSKEELKKRLRALAQSTRPRPEKLHPGAMCYAKKSFRGTVEFTCAQCRQVTHYRKGHAMESLAQSLRLLQAIRQLPHTLELELDTRFFCRHCNDELENSQEPLASPALTSQAPYKKTEDELHGLYLLIKIDEKQRRVTIDNRGLQALLAFLKDSPVMIDSRDREYPLIDETKNLRSILGLTQT